uniref:Uncharacterized protein n=1 Tax=Quercus lobata TaxID=97700 RepID=A0A7N2LHF0_QUELO
MDTLYPYVSKHRKPSFMLSMTVQWLDRCGLSWEKRLRTLCFMVVTFLIGWKTMSHFMLVAKIMNKASEYVLCALCPKNATRSIDKLIRKIGRTSSFLAELGDWLLMVARFIHIRFKHYCREANRCADGLARKGANSSVYFLLFDSLRVDLETIFNYDFNGLYFRQEQNIPSINTELAAAAAATTHTRAYM